MGERQQRHRLLGDGAEAARVGKLTRSISSVCLLGLLLYVIYMLAWLGMGIPEAIMLCVISSLMAAAYLLARGGFAYAGGGLLTVAVWGSATAAILLAGLSAPPLDGYFVAIIVAGLLLRTRGAVLMSAWVTLSLVVLGLLDAWDLLPEPRVHYRGGQLVAAHLMALGIAAALLYLAARNLGSVVRALDHRNRELGESRAELADLIQGSPDGIVVLRLDGTLVSMNESMSRMLDRSADDLVGKDVRDLGLLPPASIEAARRALGRLHHGSLPEPIEIELTPGSTSSLWVEANASRLVRGGEPLVQAVLRDITERKRAESDREELEEQLRQSQKMEALGRLAGGVAHDFNNLLTVILATVELERQSDRIHDQPLDDIRDAAERAADLTSQLLAFSRRRTLRSEPVRASSLVHGMRGILGRLLGEDISVRYVLEEPTATVFADPTSMQQVLLNLCINARDAMPRGGQITIAVTMSEVGDDQHGDVPPGSYVVLSVRDEGQGMDQATRRRAFEPFFTSKSVGEGTGLGLALVHGVVTQSGGVVCIDSEVGAGSTVSIHLPRLAEEADAVSPRALDRRPSLLAAIAVLVVEDEERVRAVVSKLLRNAGCRVFEAPNGEAGLAILEADSIDVVLSDVVMPAMSGPEMLSELRRRGRMEPVIFMSGHTGELLTRYGVDERQVRVLAKPFTSGDLERALADALRKAERSVHVA